MRALSPAGPRLHGQSALLARRENRPSLSVAPSEWQATAELLFARTLFTISRQAISSMKNAAAQMILVSIVEDDPRVRESLSVLIDGSPGMRCAGTYSSAEEALKGLPEDPSNVILMDIHLGGMTGIECVRSLRSQSKEKLIVMLTAYEDNELIFQALKAGANGYLIKQSVPDELLAAIISVHQGGAPMTSNIARKVIASFHGTSKNTPEPQTLTSREREILTWLARGYQYKEIAEGLNVTYTTVHTHIKSIYSKLHVRSRTEAVTKYFGI
jgi:DNA-binding NarL/FixJ family response regulator